MFGSPTLASLSVNIIYKTILIIIMRATMTNNYNMFSRVQGSAVAYAIEKHMPMISQFFNKLDGKAMISIADYGSATGQQFFPIIDIIKKQVRLSKVQLFMCDLPDNNFSNLFKSYQTLRSKTFFYYGVGGSFYEQLLPENILDLSFSSSSFHWLNTVEQGYDQIVNNIKHKKSVFLDAVPSQYRDIVSNKAKRDWQEIVTNRSKELEEHGLLMVVLVCKPNENDARRYMIQEMLDMAVERTPLTKEERDHFIVPIYFRGESDYLSLGDKFRILEVQRFTVENPFRDILLMESNTKQFATYMAENTRVWTQSSLLSCLEKNRSDKEKKTLCDLMYLYLKDAVQTVAYQIVNDHTRYISVIAEKM